jgi:hypothetical protein
MERVPAVQSCRAENHAASPNEFQRQQPQLDPNADLVIAWHEGHGSRREEADRDSAWQSRYVDAHAASPHDFQREQTRSDPDACLVAASEGVQSISREEIDMQKAWGQSGIMRLPQGPA